MCLVPLYSICSGYVIYSLKKALVAFDAPIKGIHYREKNLEKSLATTKKVMQYLSQSPSKLSAFVRKLVKNDIIRLFLKQINNIKTSDSQKEIALILGSMLRHSSTRRYFCKNSQLLEDVFVCYCKPNLTISFGILLREMIKYQDILSLLICHKYIMKLLDLASSKNYNLSVDAFLIFKKSYNRGRHHIVEYLEDHYREFINRYLNLILSPNFLIRSQSMRLLTTMLTETSCDMLHYYFVTDRSNMSLLLRFLQDPSYITRAAGLKILPIFVSHQSASPELSNFLRDNKEYFLESIHNVRENSKGEKKIHEVKELLDDLEITRVAKIFDPMGWISPFTTTIKLILQELWKTGMEWDDPIPEELIRKLTLINPRIFHR
ncbi:HYM1 [Cordylochernes scorpioides]|uniref:HYM1 n=1 Tax=Cordylochernes scorpioides TaxID=51811 RepID=A0ABY6K705_9ARAC|nr:HYM1 [Cordylochernes scorpioides]